MMRRQEERYGRAARFVVRARSAEIRVRRKSITPAEGLHLVSIQLGRVMTLALSGVTAEQKIDAVMRLHAIEEALRRVPERSLAGGPEASSAGRGGLHPDIRPIRITRRAVEALSRVGTAEEVTNTVRVLYQNDMQRRGASPAL